jgi:hypothetical protein
MNVVATSSEIKNAVNELFSFTVDKFPLSGPDGMQTPEYGLFRSDKTGREAYVSSRSVRQGYVPHTTDDVTALAEAASIAFDGEVDLIGGFRNGHHLSIMPTKKHRQKIIGTNESVFPRFQIRAPYGGGAFVNTCGFYRDNCRNMAELREVSSATARIRHDSNLRENMDELVEQFTALREQGWQAIMEAIETMNSRQIRLDEFLTAIYPVDLDAPQSTKTRHENTVRSIFSRIERERLAAGRAGIGSDWMVSAWEAYNGVQGHTQHKKSRKGNPTDFERIMAAAKDQHVLHAERLALAV